MAFATSEALIGVHPDGGASYYLSHLSCHLDKYLVPTEDMLNGVEMMACGLAIHYSHSAKLLVSSEIDLHVKLPAKSNSDQKMVLFGGNKHLRMSFSFLLQTAAS